MHLAYKVTRPRAVVLARLENPNPLGLEVSVEQRTMKAQDSNETYLGQVTRGETGVLPRQSKYAQFGRSCGFSALEKFAGPIQFDRLTLEPKAAYGISDPREP